MKKTKAQNAITLIALIITIVVLLILAAVAIASITNDGVLSYAENATTQYNQAVKNEQDTLQGYIDYLNKHTGGSGSSDGEVSKVGMIFTENGTINGEEYSANNPIIPKGFIPINTDTSKWDEGVLADNVSNGLVITDSVDSQGNSNGNEFVWIPVENINEMAKVTSGVDANGRTNYEGKLYLFSIITGSVEMEDYGQGTEGFMEPSNLTVFNEGYYVDYREYAERFTIEEIKNNWDEDYYQETFNKMIESVAKYKGFYVGRYEMSLAENGKAQSKAGVESLSSSSWWTLYEKVAIFDDTKVGVVSEMIWGCQYDAMMRWMEENNIDVKNEEPIDTARNKKATYNQTRITGATDSNDILNNVYDLLGNSFEWTQEADFHRGFYGRVHRGGCWEGPYWPSDRNYDYGTLPGGTSLDSSRIALYVE